MTKQEILKNYNLNLEFEESDNNFDGLYDLFVDYSIATEEEINLVVAINGQSVKSLLDILYVKSGLRSLEQLFNEIAE